MTMKTLFTTFAALCLIAVVALMTMIDTRPSVYAAPVAAGITPVAGNEPSGSKIGPLIPIVTAVVTADGRICRDTREFTTGDVQLVMAPNSTPVNMTVMLEHSNDNTNYTDGPQIVATQSAATDSLNRYDLYGAYTCVNWDIATDSTTNTVDLSVYMLPRN
jgi:hypothetical protein